MLCDDPENQSDAKMHANNRFLRDMLLEEVHTDRFLVISRKNALAVTLDHTGFAHCPIANNHHL